MQALSPKLSPKEELVYVLLQAGKSNKEISIATDTNINTIRVIKTKIKKKLGEENVNAFTPRKSPGAEHAQIQRNDLPLILSPLEYKIFLELEKSQKSHQLLAKTLGSTGDSVKKAVKQIKQKVGDFSRFFEKGIEQKLNPLDLGQGCVNCLRFKNRIHNNGSQTVICQIHNEVTYKSNEPHTCRDFKPCITKSRFQERDLLEERLKDAGYLKIAYERYALGKEPTTPSDRLKLGVSAIGCQDYLFKKRAQLLITIIQAARYTVAMLSKQDLEKHAYVEEYLDEETLKKRKRTRYPVKEFLERHRINPLKTEYDEQENNYYYVSSYVFKDIRLYRQLMTVLSEETES